jgi:ACS family hexuronate transporter-like MFS transporter
MTTEPTYGRGAAPAATAAAPAGLSATVPPALVNDLPLAANVDYAPAGHVSRFRWVVLALVFFAITINYIDRMVMGILAPDLREQFHISNQQYGNITAAFGLAYALGQLASGRWLDRVGVRLGYAIALASWCAASMLHAFARSAFGFSVARAVLGVTESPAYPAAVKTLAEWFPKKERALAMGFANAGANVGAIAAPIMVPWLALNFGWQWAFVGTGAVGLIWLAFWIPIYRRPEEHPRVSPGELAHIHSDPPEPAGKIRWITLLGKPQAWGFILGKFLTDPVWSFYLFWLPTFLKDKYGVKLGAVAAPLIVIYVMADVGSIGGGWLSSTLIKRGWSINAARKTTLLVCALAVVPAAFVSMVPNMWAAVLIVGVALSAHQGFSSNLYTLVSDTFPKRAVGSVAGMGGTFGYIGYTLFGVLTGWILDFTLRRSGATNYLPVFIICGSAYLLALLLIHLLMPRLEPATIGEDQPRGFEVVR